MKRIYIFIATVCAALSGFAQGSVVISGELSTDFRIPFPLLFQSEDEAIRDLALRKRAPNLAIGSHPYFRGPTDPTMELIPGRGIFPGELIALPFQPGFRVFPPFDVEAAILIPTPLPSLRFNDLVRQGTMLEHVALDLTVPGGHRLHEPSQIGDSAIAEFGAPTLNGDRSAPTVTVVPEPGTCALLGLAGLAAWSIRRRRR